MDSRIAFAGGLLEAFAVVDGHVASGIGDQPGLAQDACCDSDGTAADAQHHGDKFMGEGHAIGLHPVMTHEQPASEALFELMGAIAGGGLGGLHQEALNCHSIPAIERGRLTCLIRASGSRIPVVAVSARQYQRDDFADVTLDHDPQEFLRGVEAVLLGQAGVWATGMDLSREKQETPGSERSFGVLALAGWHAAAG